MTKEETEKAIEVMRAYCDGKAIQVSYKNKETWDCLTSEPLWDWFNLKYRIKPEPMEVEIWFKEGLFPIIRKFSTTPDQLLGSTGWTKKKFREIV